jgi:hypothetical protein
MKLNKLPILFLSLILALPLMAGCGDKTPENQGVLNPPTATQVDNPVLTQQTRVVLAEMFTGDW